MHIPDFSLLRWVISDVCSALSPGGWDLISHNGIFFWLLFLACLYSLPTTDVSWHLLPNLPDTSTNPSVRLCFWGKQNQDTFNLRIFIFYVSFPEMQCLWKGNLSVALFGRFRAHSFGKYFRLCNTFMNKNMASKDKAFLLPFDYDLNNHEWNCKWNMFEWGKSRKVLRKSN